MSDVVRVSVPSESASRSKMQKKGWKCWCKNVSSIDTPANSGFAWQGEFVTTGATIELTPGDVLLHVDQSSSTGIGIVLPSGGIFWAETTGADKWSGVLAKPARRWLAMPTKERIVAAQIGRHNKLIADGEAKDQEEIIEIENAFGPFAAGQSVPRKDILAWRRAEVARLGGGAAARSRPKPTSPRWPPSSLANTWTVEEHTGGREGISAGPATGTYKSEGEAVAAIIAAYGRGNTATCIARDADSARDASWFLAWSLESDRENRLRSVQPATQGNHRARPRAEDCLAVAGRLGPRARSAGVCPRSPRAFGPLLDCAAEVLEVPVVTPLVPSGEGLVAISARLPTIRPIAARRSYTA